MRVILPISRIPIEARRHGHQCIRLRISWSVEWILPQQGIARRLARGR